MNGKYLTLAGRIRQEIQELARVVRRAQAIWLQSGHTGDDYYLDAAALNLHSFYSGLERILEMIAETVDQSRPEGPSWHQELLRQMAADITGIRPAVLTPETRDALDKFRGFRHVVRNVYTYNLDATAIGQLVQALPPAYQMAAGELLQFAGFLEDFARE